MHAFILVTVAPPPELRGRTLKFGLGSLSSFLITYIKCPFPTVLVDPNTIIPFAKPLPYIYSGNIQITVPYPGSQVFLPYGFGPAPVLTDAPVFYFDIDNCLYDLSLGVHGLTQVLIHKYFKERLNLSDTEAHNLHMAYYKTYGLAVEGLVRNNQVDALEYNAKVDDALALHGLITPNLKLRAMLQALKESGSCRMWLLTNAYKNHALRCISLLGLGDLFEGLTFCDYSQTPIVCKPMTGYFTNAFAKSGLKATEETLANTYFVDDSALNCKAGVDLGMGHVVHYIERDADYEKVINSDDYTKYYKAGGRTNGIKIVRNILEIETVCSELF
ncbi:hypothetical protein BABINDRAFT_127288 [Babjeviella inositovora NRRL Y-12698]|uniref:Pyrimidine 5'-nucleotidase n=1 Tax=Babjeviella inositovora NRRL Y-12698 TaxID=984486 RepID=A0A1E3QV20_9ASCO|nr:uncharacterized protein BABINDRAFT_127288 [Babjeviella inositovora NRRL Y-12698]ODQ80807.1 hypothetical protein BABINDRAFT_127288 [Babjeviella inositovora NRRL Y-12698]